MSLYFTYVINYNKQCFVVRVRRSSFVVRSLLRRRGAVCRCVVALATDVVVRRRSLSSFVRSPSPSSASASASASACSPLSSSSPRWLVLLSSLLQFHIHMGFDNRYTNGGQVSPCLSLRGRRSEPRQRDGDGECVEVSIVLWLVMLCGTTQLDVGNLTSCGKHVNQDSNSL